MSTSATNSMISIHQLHSGYGQSEVIHGVNFSVAKGEILAIMGRNGMGKSTLFKTLMGLARATSGSITLDGKPIDSLPVHQRVRHGLAFVPQGRMVFSHMTVLENLLSGTPAPPPDSDLDEIYALFPVLFDMRQRKAGNLSGGQQQQLAIGRALLTKPKALLLDEPTEGIQPSIIKDIAKSLREIQKIHSLTILVSEQIVSFMVDVADRALVIDRGRFVHESAGSDLNPDHIKSLLAV